MQFEKDVVGRIDSIKESYYIYFANLLKYLFCFSVIDIQLLIYRTEVMFCTLREHWKCVLSPSGKTDYIVTS